MAAIVAIVLSLHLISSFFALMLLLPPIEVPFGRHKAGNVRSDTCLQSCDLISHLLPEPSLYGDKRPLLPYLGDTAHVYSDTPPIHINLHAYKV